MEAINRKLDATGRQSKWPDVSVETRFWSKVDILSIDECWNWTAGISGKGYGAFTPNWKSMPVRAHRYLMSLLEGRVLETTEVVRHKCDNVKCCNPFHLELGSQAQNIDDMVRRKRNLASVGENNSVSVLTEDAVRVIRSSNLKQRELAEIYGVTQSVISEAKRGITWKHVK